MGLRSCKIGILPLVVLLALTSRTGWCDEAGQGGSPRQAKLTEREKLFLEAQKLSGAGQFREAIEPAKRVVTLTREVFGDAGIEIADALGFLANLEFNAGDFYQAQSNWENVAARLAKLKGDKQWQTIDARFAAARAARRARANANVRERLAQADSQTAQAVTLLYQGKPGDARKLAQQVVETRRELLGEDDPDYAAGLHNVASMAAAMEDYAAAESLFQTARTKIQAVYGAEHPTFARCLFKSGQMESNRRKYAEAAQHFEQAASVYTKAQGRASPGYIDTTSALAWVRLYEGDAKKCESLRQEVLELAAAVYGKESLNYAFAASELGQSLKSRQDFPTAQQLFKSAVEIHERGGRTGQPVHVYALEDLVDAAFFGRDFETAETYSRKLVALSEPEGNPPDAKFGDRAARLGQILSMSQKHQAAIPVLNRAMSALAKGPNGTDQTYLFCVSSLGSSYGAVGDAKRAVEARREAMQLARRLLGDKHPFSASSMSSLGFAQMSAGDLDGAESSFKEAIDLRRAAYGEAHAEYALGFSQLAGVYAARSDWKQARQFHLKALEVRKLATGENDPEYAWELAQLAAACATLGELDDAERHAQTALRVFEKLNGRDAEIIHAQITLERVAAARGDRQRVDAILGDVIQRERAMQNRHDGSFIAHLAVRAGNSLLLNRWAAANTDLDEALELCRKVHGVQHREYARLVEQSGLVAESAGELRQAETLYREASDIWKNVAGDRDPSYADALRKLGSIRRALGNMSDAERDLLQAEAIFAGAKDANRSEVAECWLELARLNVDRRDEAQVVQYQNRALEFLAATAGPNDELALAMLERAGGQCVILGDFDRALKLLKQCTSERKRSGPASVPYASSLMALESAYLSAGDYSAAEEACREALSIYEAQLGPKDFQCGRTHEALASARRTADRAAVMQEYDAAAAIYRELFGPDNEHSARVATLRGLNDTGRANYAEAETAFLEALTIFRTLNGPESLPVSATLEHLGVLYAKQADYRRAEDHLTRSLALKRELLHGKDAALADALDTFGVKCQSMNPVRAEGSLLEARDLRRGVFGEAHPTYAASLQSLGQFYSSQGQLTQSERLLTAALEIRERSPGVGKLQLAETLSTLGLVLASQDRLKQAESVLLRAADLQQHSMGESRVAYLVTLLNLGITYLRLGDNESTRSYGLKIIEECRKTFGADSSLNISIFESFGHLLMVQLDSTGLEQAFTPLLDRMRQQLGPRHMYVAVLGFMRGAAREQAGDLRAAETDLRESVSILREQPHANYATLGTALSALGRVEQRRGFLAGAEALFAETAELTSSAVGTENLSYVYCLNSLASVKRARGHPADAEALYHQSLQIGGRFFDMALDMLSERQQLAVKKFYRHTLDGYLALGPAAPVERAYAHVLRSKGAVALRQRQLNAATRQPELRGLYSELEDLTGRLTTAALSTRRAAPEGRQSLQQWTRRKEEIERELTDRSVEFRKGLDEARLTPAELAQRLPDKTVLIDFVEYTDDLAGGGNGTGDQQFLTAFVVRRGQAVRRIDLGGMAPIAVAIESWRQTYGPSAAKELRRLIWEPLLEKLRDAELVLLSGDGPLHRFPWPALPAIGRDGKSQPAKYLIEETSVVLAPIPQLLPELLSAAPRKPAQKPAVEKEWRSAGQMLLVGDVDFNSDVARPVGNAAVAADDPAVHANGNRNDASRQTIPSRAGEVRGIEQDFQPLPGAKDEVSAIERIWKRSTAPGQAGTSPVSPIRLLRGGEATERSFRRFSAQADTIHLATHGFYGTDQPLPPAPLAMLSSLTSADPASALSDSFGLDLTAFNPGATSGLALAGANRFRKGGDESNFAEDGLLTATEVERLDLRAAELVVLSACETGLGREVSGETVLGLPRAFHVAGARTVVSSLWKVSDQATRLLMEEFYRNLRERRLPRAEALRQAQLYMLREGRTWKDGRTGRSLDLDADHPLDEQQQLHPHYWAAFVLSGDWR